MHRGLANHSYSRCRVATSRQNSGFGMSLRKFDSKYSSILLGGGFTFFSPLPGETIQFDQYFSKGLKPPTRPDDTLSGFYIFSGHQGDCDATLGLF